MKTELTKSAVAHWLANNASTIEHKWSTRGYGDSRILIDAAVIAKASGCGYDRFGKVLGDAIIALFPDQVHTLAKRECKQGARRTYKSSKNYYGLFFNAETQEAWLDGACGSREMTRILNKIGFSLVHRGETESRVTGSVFYSLEPLSDHERKYHN